MYNSECFLEKRRENPPSFLTGMSQASVDLMYDTNGAQIVRKTKMGQEPKDKVFPLSQHHVATTFHYLQIGVDQNNTFIPDNKNVVMPERCDKCHSSSCHLLPFIECDSLAELLEKGQYQEAHTARLDTLKLLAKKGYLKQQHPISKDVWVPYLYQSVDVFNALPDFLSVYQSKDETIELLATVINKLLNPIEERIAGIYPRDLNVGNIFLNRHIIDQDLWYGDPAIMPVKMAFTPVGLNTAPDHVATLFRLDEELFHFYSSFFKNPSLQLDKIHTLMTVELLKNCYRLESLSQSSIQTMLNLAKSYYSQNISH